MFARYNLLTKIPLPHVFWKTSYTASCLAGLLLLTAGIHGDSFHSIPKARQPAAAAFPSVMPPRVLWAWEEPEDMRFLGLRFLDPRQTGVAYLAETLLLGDEVRVKSRHQPLLLAPGTLVMAVVRIEPGPGGKGAFRDSPELRRDTAANIAALARPGVAAIQVDFDAARSQRAFYADVLRQVRARLPARFPLSITALLSWCTADDWIAGLPVDEAVPMHFRLGREVRDPLAQDPGAWRSVEPLCQGSFGVSTDEPWPRLSPGSRVYIFAPHPWTARDYADASGLALLKGATL